MDTFLDFLNTAEISELVKLSGLDFALAERIVEARPFATEADLVKVNGLAEKKIAALKDAFEKSDQIIYMSNQTPARIPEPSRSNNATITIKTDNGQEKSASTKGNGSWVKRVFSFLLGLILILAFLGGLVAAVYYGVPYFYEKIIKPIELNTVQISQIATQQAADLTDMQGVVDDLQMQLNDLQSRNEIVEVSITSHTESIAQLESLQAALELALAEQQETLTEKITTERTAILNRLELDLMITRAIELLSRGTLYLSQSNYGLARQDIHQAYSLLTGYLPYAPKEERLFLLTVNQRLELALNNLPAYPVIAANDVQIAWQYLVDGGVAAEAIPIPLLTPSFTPSPTPTPIMDIDETTLTLTPTAN
jgi:hypothetical protein